MTEEQIDYLKEVLENSSAKANSPELDQRILKAAARHKPADEPKSFIAQALGKIPFGEPLSSLGTASAAVGMTLVMLLVLSLLFTTQDSQELPISGSQIVIELKPNTSSVASADQSRPERIARPDQAYDGDDSFYARPLITQDLVLPETDALLASFDYAPLPHRQDAKESISVAMNEIRQMIGGGQIKHAKDRYVELVENCHVCTLPATLEDLVFAGKSRADSG